MMFNRILVPLDGGQTSEAALPTARALAGAPGAELHLVRVVRRPAAPLDEHAEEIREAAHYLDNLARELGSNGLLVTTHVRSGEPAEAILAEITAQGADLLVMTTRGRGGIVRAVLGSVASEVLPRSPVPVILLREDSRSLVGIRRLLAPVDGSAQSLRALEVAAHLARASGARLTVLEVVAPIPAWAYAGGDGFALSAYLDPDWELEVLAHARRYVDGLVEHLRGREVRADGRATLGDVPETIAQVAADVSADLIVMSTHARTGPARAVLGSVADAVVRQAEQPVLLLPSANARAALSPDELAEPAVPAETTSAT